MKKERKSPHVLNCKKCNNLFTINITPWILSKGTHVKFCSSSCANSYNHIGDKNPMYGKKPWVSGLTTYTDERLKKRGEKMSGKNHPNYGKKMSDESKLKQKKSIDNDEWRSKMSIPFIEKYKNKYGDNWEYHYNEFIKSMKKTNTLEWFIGKHGETIGTEKYNERCKKLKTSGYFNTYNQLERQDKFSKISQELFWNIHEVIKDKFKKIYFAELNNEHSCGTGSYRFDFVIIDNKKIIEFNGNKFHPKNLNEQELETWSTPHGVTGKTIKERDDIKQDKSKSKGFNLLYIWEDEYLNDKEKTLKNCLAFLMS